MKNKITGSGLLNSLFVTFKHYIQTYLEDIRWRGKRYKTQKGIEQRMSSQANGIFTVQYPEEKLPVPEEFRYIPFLLYEIDEKGKKRIRCTACGICAQVCPPQCISIEREINPRTKRPVANPSKFYIDIDICMNCGLCAEYCPFDSIKMDHDYEIASYNRKQDHIYDMEKLLKPVTYYANIRPYNYHLEEMARERKKTIINAGSSH